MVFAEYRPHHVAWAHYCAAADTSTVTVLSSDSDNVFFGKPSIGDEKFMTLGWGEMSVES